MKPSDALGLHRDAIIRIVHTNNALNPRVFGSTARGEDSENSDLDMLVDAIDGKTTLLSLARIKTEIESITRVKVDVCTVESLSAKYRDQVLREAIPL